MPMSIEEFVETQQAHTGLRWLAGRAGSTRMVGNPELSPPDLIGYLNLIHAHRVGILGPHEVGFFERSDEAHRSRMLEDLFQARPPALIICDGLPAPQPLLERCERESLPLLGTSTSAARTIESLRFALSRDTGDHTSVHGVLMDVLGMGVMISGESGLGKSELALELISRGHGLVADDVIEISRVGPNSLEGRCPALLHGLLEVRGLGLLDIKTVFGETAVRRKMKLKLIVHLIRRSTMDNQYERLPLEELNETILGIPVRKVVIPVAAGRNLAVLAEAAVRSTVLLLRGIDTTRDFVRRQQRIIADSDPFDENDYE